MISGAAIAAILGLAALAWVLGPLFRAAPAGASAADAGLSEARELQSERDMLLASLTDLEDDRQLGKLDEADFEELNARLSGQAVEVLRRLDGLEADRDRAVDAAHPVLPYPKARRPDGSR